MQQNIESDGSDELESDTFCNINTFNSQYRYELFYSIKILILLQPQPRCYLKHSLQQTTEQYPQFVEVIVFRNSPATRMKCNWMFLHTVDTSECVMSTSLPGKVFVSR